MARYSTYAPAFSIQINGDTLPAALQASIVSVNYQDGMEGADRVEVTFANPGLQWLDHPLLQIDNAFKLSIGYAPDPLEEVFVGEVTGVEPSFPGSGMPAIKVTAQDFLNRLTHGKVDRAFYVSIPKSDNFPLPDIAVAAIVSGSNLLIPVPDPVGGALSILMTVATYVNVPGLMGTNVRRQESESDFDFLSTISRQNGWEMYIDHTMEPRGYMLRFQFLLQDYSASLSLKYGESLMDFTPRITNTGDVFGVSARVWISAIKMEFVIVVGWDFDRATINLAIYPGVGALETFIDPKKAAETISIKQTGFPTTVQAVLGELLPRLNNRLTASGNSIGDPRIKASRVINIDGVGDQFGGLYRITQANHTFDSGGYRTSFQARKEVWFGSIPLPKDPANMFRIQGQRV